MAVQDGTTASAADAQLLRELREAAGYTLEQLAITCGLTIDELAALEAGADHDPGKLQRIAASLGLIDSPFSHD